MWIKKYQNAPGPLPTPDFSIESAANRPIVPEFATEEAAAKRAENAEKKRRERDGKQIEYIARYNLEHGTHFWNIDQVREHAAQNGAANKPIVNTGDEISILQQIRQNQADAAAKVDIDSGNKSAQGARQDAQKEFVVDPAVKEAITGATLMATAPKVALYGAVPVVSDLIGGTLGQVATDRATNYFSNGKYNTFGEFVRGGKDWGTLGNFGSEMPNPGAWIGGRIGAAAPGRIKLTYN